MTTTPDVPAAGQVEFEVARADAMLSGRAMFLAGLLVAAEADTVDGPHKLAMDLWPDVDPAVVEAIQNRAFVVAHRMHQFAESPRLHGDRLRVLQARLTEAGFEAMGRAVGRSRRVVDPHPADGETARGRATGVTSRTSDTS